MSLYGIYVCIVFTVVVANVINKVVVFEFYGTVIVIVHFHAVVVVVVILVVFVITTFNRKPFVYAVNRQILDQQANE